VLPAPHPQRPFGQVVDKAVGCAGDWWLRTSSGGYQEPGALWIIAPETGTLVDSIPSAVVDINRSINGNVYALVRRSVHEGATTLGVLRRDRSAFIDEGGLVIGDAHPIGIGDLAGRPYVITSREIHQRSSNGTWVAKKLARELTEATLAGLTTGATYAGDSIYVGWDRGEFGGGLLRIDQSGAVSAIPVSRVTAILGDPTSSHCVVVATGVEYFVLSVGRVVQVCGTTIRVLMAPKSAEAFYGVLSEAGGYRVISSEAIYRVGPQRPRTARSAGPYDSGWVCLFAH
jgi:hypothetical protein